MSTEMIHPTAIIDSEAKIADGVSIGPYVVIGAGVSIDSGCRVEQFTSINGPTEIGSNNHIFPFCSIGADPQDKKYQSGEVSALRIGNNNTFREYCSINRGTKAGLETVVGNDNWIMAGVHLAHDCVLGNNCVLANHVALSGHVQLGDYVTLSGFTGVAQFCRIGSHAFAAGKASIDGHVPPFAYIAGDRARFISINSKGLARRGYSEQDIALIKKAYRQWRQRNGNEEAALNGMRQAAPDNASVNELVDFIRAVSDSHLQIVSPRRANGVRQATAQQA